MASVAMWVDFEEQIKGLVTQAGLKVDGKVRVGVTGVESQWSDISDIFTEMIEGDYAGQLADGPEDIHVRDRGQADDPTAGPSFNYQLVTLTEAVMIGERNDFRVTLKAKGMLEYETEDDVVFEEVKMNLVVVLVV